MDAKIEVKPTITMGVSVPVPVQRTWQRKWRDVLHAYSDLSQVYQGHVIHVDNFTRTIENFFKTCRELVDWIQESTSLPALDYARDSPTLEICDALAQTAKHHTRDPQFSRDPITGVVVELFGDPDGRVHADVKWTSDSRANGTADALALADRCIAEWVTFFQLHKLEPGA